MVEHISITDCQIPDRSDDGHKGTFGRVLLVAGSDGMSGAACLAGKAALRGGAGLVTLMVPKGIQPIVAGYEPGYMTIGFDTAAVSLEKALLGVDAEAVKQLKASWEDKNVIAIGPGIGQEAVAQQLTEAVVRESPCPVVLDADALNLCAVHGLLEEERASEEPIVVTPHPGEMARLMDTSIDHVQSNRKDCAATLAEHHQVIVILKGPETVVTDGARLYINETGNSGMATGGSGDVLTGLTAAVIAQGVPAFDAACVAVWLHGAAGDSAAEAFSKEAMIASDLPEHFGRAWRRLRN